MLLIMPLVWFLLQLVRPTVMLNFFFNMSVQKYIHVLHLIYLEMPYQYTSTLSFRPGTILICFSGCVSWMKMVPSGMVLCIFTFFAFRFPLNFYNNINGKYINFFSICVTRQKLWGCIGSLDMLGYEEMKSLTGLQRMVLFRNLSDLSCPWRSVRRTLKRRPNAGWLTSIWQCDMVLVVLRDMHENWFWALVWL